MAAHAHIPINCMHSHAHHETGSQVSHAPPQTVTPINHESQTLAPHATCTPAFPTPASLGASLDPALRVLFPLSQLTGLRPGRSCRGQEQAEAGPRLARAPAAPVPAGPTLKAGDQPRRLRGAASPGARCSPSAADSTRDPQETARDPALASPCAPAPGQAELKGRGQLTAGVGNWERSLCLSADWPAKGGALSQGAGPFLPTPGSGSEKMKA